VSRLQSLPGAMSLYLALSGQYSDRNLDTAEQFLLGGPDSVRGYAVSTLAGARGYLATAELRHDLALTSFGLWQGSVFVDQGGMTVNAQPWPGAAGSNRPTLGSAGVGLDWSGPARWAAKVQLATPVGPTRRSPASAPRCRYGRRSVRCFEAYNL
jgi:hemolysin activation/secretion protein